MKKLNRKKFLQLTALASGAVFVPEFLSGLSRQFTPLLKANNKVLVIIQLSGGNDGLNTFIPYNNDLYYQLRPTLSYQKNDILKVTDEMGFNPGMSGLRKLYDQGDLAIINNIGYPNPDHSHFRSMDIWNSASGSDQYLNTGWLGRYLDASCHPCNHSHLAVEVDDTLSLTLKGSHAKAMAISNPGRLYQATRDEFFQRLCENNIVGMQDLDTRSYLYKTLIESNSSVTYVYNQSKIFKSNRQYPVNKFGNSLRLITELICSGSETKVYYISLSGFDTHARQKQVHERLLNNLADGLETMVSELRQNNMFNNTLIMAFSEFGRRVKQNASEGTDHGEANNLILAGGSLKQKGFINGPPLLNELSSGNIKFQVDFRNVYATILNKWLQADDTQIIGTGFEKMNFI